MSFPVKLAIILCATGSLYAAQTKDVILMGLVSNHNLVFGKEDLFVKPLQTQEWYRFLDEAKQFVAQNARGDALLTKAFVIILFDNDSMINSIKIAYNALFTKPHEHIQEEIARNALISLENIVVELELWQNILSEESYIFTSKKDVREVLIKLALFIEVTAQKAARELLKRMTYEHLM